MVIKFFFLLLLASCGEDNSQDNENNVISPQEIRQSFIDSGLEKPVIEQQDTELVELGRKLFFDKVLSGNQNISCGTCHHPTLGSGDGLNLPIGEGGIGLGTSRSPGSSETVPRNAPAIYNLDVNNFSTMMWDGRIAIDQDGFFNSPDSGLNGSNPLFNDMTDVLENVLALQALFPVTSHAEMLGQPGSNSLADSATNRDIWDGLTQRVTSISEYVSLLNQAYPDVTNVSDYNFAHIANAIASFEKEAFSVNNSRFDQFLSGDDSALSELELKGAELFVGRAKCISCHSGANFSDESFHSLGVPQFGPGKGPILGEDLGREAISQNSADKYKFRTPPLRNVELSGPWFHSGSHIQLKDVIRHHLYSHQYFDSFINVVSSDPDTEVDLDVSRNNARKASVDPILRQLEENESFTEEDVSALEAFLLSLTDESSLDDINEVPDSVPSGLTIDN